ncbi:MAG: transcriptional regulator, GntR family [Leifsonia sp.]|jgi:GntR family transcriptional regulator|nr:transcriptional regulator, GntR family [Leifsonia sp.]
MPTPTPLKHEQIAAALERDIRSGVVAHGGQLPGETTLAERFSVSRNTVRAALAALSLDGLIVTRSGKGSFVTYDERPLDARLGWAEALQHEGLETHFQVLRLERIRDDALAGTLGIDSPDFIAIDRVRTIVGGPAIALERSRVPVTPATAGMPERGLPAVSLTQVLIDAGLIANHGEQRVGARPLTAAEAEELGRGTADWFLCDHRTTWSADGGLVEDVESMLDPRHFGLRLQFSED